MDSYPTETFTSLGGTFQSLQSNTDNTCDFKVNTEK